MMNHVLFPCDLSAHTEIAFKRLMDLVVPLRAKVTLFHAYQLIYLYQDPVHDQALTTSAREIERQLEAIAQTRMKAFKQRLLEARIDCELLIMPGKPGPAIIEAAQYRACDLIVLGSRGLGPVSSFFLGSTSTYVLQHSTCPVLVIPFKAPEA